MKINKDEISFFEAKSFCKVPHKNIQVLLVHQFLKILWKMHIMDNLWMDFKLVLPPNKLFF